jgi:hypothetical protein
MKAIESVVMGAFLCVWIAAILWIMNGLSEVIFGYNLFNLIIEAIFLFLVCLVIGSVLYAPISFLANSERTKENWAGTIILMLFFFVVIPHVIMSIGLRDMKREFTNEAGTTPIGESYEPPSWLDDKGTTHLDYGGRLTRIVNRRSEVLNHYWFYAVGGWRTTDAGASTSCVYLFTGLRNLNHRIIN